MKTGAKMQRLFWLGTACLALMSATILLMPVAVNTDGNNTPLMMATGIAFWLLAIGGLVALIAAGRQWRLLLKKLHRKPVGRIGLLHFFSTPAGCVADVAMPVSLVLIAVLRSSWYKNSYLVYILFFVFVLSLNTHGLFNGRIYKTIISKK